MPSLGRDSFERFIKKQHHPSSFLFIQHITTPNPQTHRQDNYTSLPPIHAQRDVRGESIGTLRYPSERIASVTLRETTNVTQPFTLGDHYITHLVPFNSTTSFFLATAA